MKTYAWTVLLSAGVLLLVCSIGVAVSSAKANIAADEDIANVYGGIACTYCASDGMGCMLGGVENCYVDEWGDCEGFFYSSCRQTKKSCQGPGGLGCIPQTKGCEGTFRVSICEWVGEDCMFVYIGWWDCTGDKSWCKPQYVLRTNDTAQRHILAARDHSYQAGTGDIDAAT